jgi:hypothetical protein
LPGRNQREAVDAFAEVIADIVSCVARVKITLSPGGRGMVGKIHGLTINDDKPVRLGCRPPLLLRIRMEYEIVRAGDRPERGPWRVSTRGYAYELRTDSGERVWSYHWHPQSAVANPHVHIGHTQLAGNAVLSSKIHYPTGRISLESVIRTCIAGHGVPPQQRDWEETLALRESDFETYRSWS